jgi:glycosyltransferase involved in cell wall biosynthesis
MQTGDPNAGVRKVAMLGNHLPRHCGIATFTSDLTTAIASELPDGEVVVLAMNEPEHRYEYPSRVVFEIGEAEVESYRRAADFLNVAAVDVVSLQHEYGIFGGKAGVLLLDLLRELRMPVVTTLHTVLADPNPAQRAVMDEITSLSERIVVMSADGAALLHQVHHVDPKKIDVIPHGIPVLPHGRDCKDKLGLADNEVILTFGLLSPDKGIEYVIDALPRIAAARPNAIYVVLGVTHPHVKEHEGEAYRTMLAARAKRIGVDAKVVFYDRFVSQEELVEFLSAADIYVTPYVKAEQITSGTLAYAVGSGKAVISTPYRYAREMLDEGRGVLVPWRDADAIATAAIDLLANDEKRKALQERAAAYGKHMTWPVVARGYVDSFARARASHGTRQRARFRARTLARRPADLPDVNLAHLRTMTDDTGLLQHAALTIPRYADGYCTDDNARALLLTTMLEEAGIEPLRSVRPLAARYFAFILHAFCEESGRFHNFMDYSRRWVPGPGSEDSHGRALWALGGVVGRASEPTQRALAGQLFHAALPAVRGFTSPRAWAYALLGIDEYLKAYQGESSVEVVMALLTDKLMDLLARTSTPAWPWFEDRLTYCNARLPQALIAAGARMKREDVTAAGLRTLEWLAGLQSLDGYFAPIGSNGFYVRGGSRAAFDQQPVDASATISACLDAYRITGQGTWSARASAAFYWFLGQNQLQLALYDTTSGGCRDGLHPDRANENQGAESTLSFLLALSEMRAAERVAGTFARPLRAASPTADDSRPRASEVAS